MQKEKFAVTGMTCSACSAAIEKNVNKLDGVSKAQVNLLANHMMVDYDESKIQSNDIIHAVEDAGYGAQPIQNNPAKASSEINMQKQLQQQSFSQMRCRLIVSFAFMIPLMYISMGHMFNWPLPNFLLGEKNALTFAFLQFLLSLPIIYVNRKYYQGGFKALLHGRPNMDSLIAIGSSAALLYGIFAIFQIGIGLGRGDMMLVHQYSMDLYFESAAMILTLITLGKYFEERSKNKTFDAISKLIDLAPKTALVEREGVEQQLPIEQVVIGDIIIVKPGQSIPVDGIILEGTSSIDQSALTGESIPVEKNRGDRVIAASINKTGYFKFKADKVGDDTTLAQIIQLVEEASSSKAPIAKMADKISGIFVPIVIAIAIIATVIWLILGKPFEFALSIGIAILVISCPCALGLATPVAIMVGTGKAANYGILIKSAEALEIAHTVDTVVLDKTGTITQGKPVITDMITVSNMDEKTLLHIAATIEKPSEHPLAEAILQKAQEENIELASLSDFKAVSGRGVEGNINGMHYMAGNLAWMQENAIDVSQVQFHSDALATQGKTPLYFANEQSLLGIIAVADIIKPTSKQAIHQLKSMGIRVIMLTGDNKRTAEAIRSQLDLDEAISELMPQDKEGEIRKAQQSGAKVAMVGDGINDAPALARADVGIAIGAGTDIAIESADIVLMKSDLLDVVTTIQLSKSVIKNIKQNLFWAFFYNMIGIPLAAGVFFYALGWKLNPMFAAAAMSLSSICVVSNALRLRWFKPQFSHSNQQSERQTSATDINLSHIATAPHNDKAENIKNIVTMESENNMKKRMNIEGMTCDHCKARVEKALNQIDGVTASVDLEQKTATLELSQEVEDATLHDAATQAGYEVPSIKTI